MSHLAVVDSVSNGEQSDPIIQVASLSKVFSNGQSTRALDKVSFSVERGTFLAIVGVSGSGKSTLLHLLAGLDRPSPEPGQQLDVCGVSLLNRSESWLARFRAQHTGFVLQFFGLLPTMTVLENVLLAGYFGGTADRIFRAKELLATLGLSDRLHHYPSQLSGGQRQRVAIARALINNPPLIFADEPTGNLDSKSGRDIFHQLALLNQTGLTVVLVSHDLRAEDYATRLIELEDGRILRDSLL